MATQPRPTHTQATLPRLLSWFGPHRCLTIIPALFILLIITTVAFTLHSIKLNKHLNDLVRVISWQRSLKRTYLLNLLNYSGKIPVISANAPLRELQNNLRTQLYGGTIHLPDSPESFYLKPAESSFVRKELQRKMGLYIRLEQEGRQLLKFQPGTMAYREHLLAFNAILRQIELPEKDVLKYYLTGSNNHLNNILMLEVLTVILASILGIFLSFQQKNSDKALEESELRFRQVFDTGPLGKVLIHLGGKPFRVNPALSQILGYSDEALLEHTAETLSHPDDFAKEKPLRDALMMGQIKSYQIQKRYRHKLGHYIWANVTTAVVNDHLGEPVFVIIQVQDISEQRKTLEALQLSEAQYRNVVESATDGIIVANMQSVVLSANSQAHQIFGYEPGKMAGTSLVQIIPPAYRHLHEAAMHHLSETRQPRLTGRLLEMEGLRQSGEIFPVELSLAVWADQEGEFFATAILRDITERKNLQREREFLLQSNKSLEEFNMITSHDLQEPLRKIAFYTERFTNRESERLKEESLLDIQRLLSSVHRMQNLIKDLLAYSRISPQNTRFTMVNLNQLLHELRFEMMDEIQGCQASVEIEDLPAIEADEPQMRTLFSHLIHNSLKYRQPGVSPEIRIYGRLLERTIGNTPILEIDIKDNGMGFDEKYLDRIFKVFQKLHGQTEFPGTGVGLATCRKIMDQHTGSITATSQPGNGAVFTIHIPIRQASNVSHFSL